MNLSIKKVQMLMVSKCITNTEFVKAAGISPSTWYYLKKGKTKANSKTIGKIAKALEVRVEEIIV